MQNKYKLYQFSCIPSTNNFAKTLIDSGENALIFADEQSGGRGTKGRSFFSKQGGVYATKLDFYQNFPTKNAFEIMAKTAAAVCKTLEDFHLKPCVKWPNDIFVSDKKICGILIENAFDRNTIKYSIVGIGLNVCNELPDELQSIATTMRLQLKNAPSVEQVKARLLTHLQADFCMQDYLSRVGYLGKECDLLIGDELVPATLLSVDEQGGLHVKMQGEEKRLTSAEISLRIKHTEKI